MIFLYFSNMATYKERIDSRSFYIILRENKALGLFGSLTKLCEVMKKKDVNFPSYWTITRMDKTKPIDIGDYRIQKMQVYSETNLKNEKEITQLS